MVVDLDGRASSVRERKQERQKREMKRKEDIQRGNVQS